VQLAQIEQSFGTMLRQLPGETEIPSLIVDISQTGLAAGLQEKLFQPQAEVPKDFYAEKPIKIHLTGGYHEMANFVSGIAALPRIVTLHDITITPEQAGSFDSLNLEVTAKTYRYIEETEPQ
jgi:type IV pilus assembly protein PilO